MRFLLLLLFSALAISLGAQTPSFKKSPSLLESTSAPQSAGMHPARLARIDAMCESALADGDVPGMVALVVRDGRIVYHKAFGMADSESGRKMKPDDIFRIASQTKAITSTAVMMLWEEGKFRLDDPISKYIPEFKNPQVLQSFRYNDTSYTTVPAKSEITIRQLLTHTAGLGYGFIDGDERMKMIYQKAGIIDAFTLDPIRIGDNVKKLAQLPLHFHPGEQYRYSEGLDVLGYFVEIISGMPFDQFLQSRIFQPMGMNDTYFYLPEAKASRLVSVQMPSEGKWVKVAGVGNVVNFPIEGAKTFFSGGAGLCSTAKDYATFLQMYLNGGELKGTRILSRTTIASMMANQTGDLFTDKDRYYGLAFGVLNEQGHASGGKGSVGTFDWGGYFNTSYFADPKERIIGVLMKQTMYQRGDDTGWQFRMLVEQAVDD